VEGLMPSNMQVVFDCADPERVARFWCAALGYELDWEWDDETIEWMRSQGLPESDVGSRSAAVDPSGRGPRLFFQRVPEGKSVKNRVHIDTKAPEGGIDAEVQRLVALGAVVVHRTEGDFGPFHEIHYVMQDVEGNEFCVS
jgi:catechol 2,3-dioxygenase-like lactoylglutathione lyase family enzyme